MVNKFQRAMKAPRSKTVFTRPEGAGNFDNMDDHNIVKAITTKQGTIQHTPTNPMDIVNKAYVDEKIMELLQNYTILQDDESSILQYVGWAEFGSDTNTSVWRIRRITFDSLGDSAWEWADANDEFDNIWDNRTSLSYS